MRTVRYVVLFIAALLISSTARAQSPLAGQDLRLVPLTTAPSNLGNGNAGIWNHNGLFSWTDASGVTTPLLICSICSASATTFSVAGFVQSTVNGFKFPDNTVQTTAATAGLPANYLFTDPAQLAQGTVLVGGCASGQGWFLEYTTVAARTTATRWRWNTGATVTGVKFGYAYNAGGRAVTCRLWSAAGAGSSVAVGTVTPGAAGIATCTFNTPYVVTGAAIGATFKASVYDATGYSRISSCDGSFPIPATSGYPLGGPSVNFGSLTDYANGDTFPNNTGGDATPVSPIFTVP